MRIPLQSYGVRSDTKAPKHHVLHAAQRSAARVAPTGERPCTASSAAGTVRYTNKQFSEFVRKGALSLVRKLKTACQDGRLRWLPPASSTKCREG